MQDLESDEDSKPGKKRKRHPKAASLDMDMLLADAEEAKTQQKEVIDLAKTLMKGVEEDREARKLERADQAKSMNQLLELIKARLQ